MQQPRYGSNINKTNSHMHESPLCWKNRIKKNNIFSYRYIIGKVLKARIRKQHGDVGMLGVFLAEVCALRAFLVYNGFEVMAVTSQRNLSALGGTELVLLGIDTFLPVSVSIFSRPLVVVLGLIHIFLIFSSL